MKNCISNRNCLFLLGVNIALVVVFYTLFSTQCFSQCTLNTREGLIVPAFWLSLMSLPISFFFLFFPQRIFTAWLKRIAWWYVLVLFLVTITTPVFSSNILSLDRGQIVFGGMIGLLSITVPYVVLMHKKQD